jgi:glyoxylase-like metal-dependent hydrolase (beta-lactamase superfamily II)
MHRERVSENVFWFQSEIYAQVTAGVVAGPQWAVVIDTLALPDETLTIREFIEHELSVPVRYVINTHYHADHTWGTCFFPGATVIAQARCRDLLEERGIPSLEAAQKQNPALRQVKIVLPHITFMDGELTLRVGKKNMIISSALGHSSDGIAVLVEEDRILFAGDSFMPLPYIVDGNIDDITASIKRIGRMGLENIVQGHGDIILRGEIDAAVRENLNYLAAIKKAVKAISRRKNAIELLDSISIEDCGKSRVYLGGLAEILHQRNLRALLQQMTGEYNTSPS